jgi:hypothetical protein
LLALLIRVSPAGAVPDPTKSKTDPILVGNSSGADMGNGFNVVVRDIGNIPLPGRNVTLIFFTNNARPDQVQESGTSVDCTSKILGRITDSQGQVVFHAEIAGYDNALTVQVRASGVLLNTVVVRSTDIDGNGATDLRDLNAFRERFVMDRTAPETDFNHDGVTNGYDFDLLREEFVRGARNAVCP